jgi:hypothetical protein
MRLVAILVVMAVIGVLASRQLGGHHGATGSVPAAQGVVNDARKDLSGAEAKQQAQQDAQDQAVSQP